MGDRNRYMDAHIHLDSYAETDIFNLLKTLDQRGIDAVVSVSMHEMSCRKNLQLARQYPNLIWPAFGYHPEQRLPSEEELQSLLAWMASHRSEMVAIGEVGLPYYMRQEALQLGENFEDQLYIQLLEVFVQLASEWNVPIVLHAVYEDAEIACDLLEKYGVKKAHFHWFKAEKKTVERLVERGYFISFTPDVLYESEIRQLAEWVPIELMMVETDGPWPFLGPFADEMTEPGMVTDVVRELAAIKGISEDELASVLYNNTVRFYKPTPTLSSRKSMT